ncbi:MerR family transcriptional regulator [Serinibacter arcticus]|uniref:MerR family transcriptional regulator n=1 Tax=Serinibacter arcticus TaxID=1655435 RepID=UPI0018EEA4DC|nr:MerR family transcriptional regulator [Serinibacter arcticus]
MSWTIQDVSRTTGVTSRTLRHYDAIGLLPASFVGPGGIRHYDDDALVRLQRILLLKDLGLGLAAIGEVVDGDGDVVAHLRTHLELLEVERAALDRRIGAVRRTIEAREGEEPMTSDMFDGFDHTQYQDEVSERWGSETYAASDRWWRGLTPAEQAAFKARVAQLSADWIAAARDGEAPDGERARELSARHIAWLTATPGTPAAAGDPEQTRAYVLGLAEMYVADPRFARNYAADDVPDGAAFVRDALTAHVASGALGG